MKPIQTQYKGYHFRSRLEARWAVVLDHMNYAWEYEPEGFELSSGRYLPDFWLPEVETWVEVKGGAPSKFDLDRFVEFTRDVNARGHRARMLIGQVPDPRQAVNAMANRVSKTNPEVAQRLLAQEGEKSWGMIDAWVFTPDWIPVSAFTPSSRGDFLDSRLHSVGFEPGLGADLPSSVKVSEYRHVPLEHWSLKSMPWIPGGDVAAALAAGRSARFEHGQSGA